MRVCVFVCVCESWSPEEETNSLAGAQTCSRNFLATSNRFPFHSACKGMAGADGQNTQPLAHITASNNSNNERERPVDFTFIAFAANGTQHGRAHIKFNTFKKASAATISSNGDGVEGSNDFLLHRKDKYTKSFVWILLHSFWCCCCCCSALLSGMSYDSHITSQPMTRERVRERVCIVCVCVSTLPTFCRICVYLIYINFIAIQSRALQFVSGIRRTDCQHADAVAHSRTPNKG